MASFGSHAYTHVITFKYEDYVDVDLTLAVEGHSLTGLDLSRSVPQYAPTRFMDNAVFEQEGTGYTFVNATNDEGYSINFHFLEPIRPSGTFNMAFVEPDGSLAIHRLNVPYEMKPWTDRWSSTESTESTESGPAAQPAPVVPASAEQPATEPTEAFFNIGPWRINVTWKASSHDLTRATIESLV